MHQSSREVGRRQPLARACPPSSCRFWLRTSRVSVWRWTGRARSLGSVSITHRRRVPFWTATCIALHPCMRQLFAMQRDGAISQTGRRFWVVVTRRMKLTCRTYFMWSIPNSSWVVRSSSPCTRNDVCPQRLCTGLQHDQRGYSARDFFRWWNRGIGT